MKEKIMFGASASTLLWWVNEIRIWAGVLAAIAAVVTGAASYYQIRLTSVVSAEKDRTFARFRAESEERTARAQAEAAAANERTAALEGATADARAEQERLAEGNAKLGIQLEQERRERLELERKFAWRRLTEEQKLGMHSFLIGRPIKVEIMSISNDPESIFFAKEIGQIFIQSGSDVVCNSMLTTNTIIGIGISPEPGQDSLVAQTAFAQVNIPFAVIGSVAPSTGRVRVTSGIRPQQF